MEVLYLDLSGSVSSALIEHSSLRYQNTQHIPEQRKPD
jgi:hypothetical protein